jgi:flagellar hook-basal body complex protein FliE
MEPLFRNLLAPPAWPDTSGTPGPSAPSAPFGAAPQTQMPLFGGAAPAANPASEFGQVISRFLGQVNAAQGDADRMVEALALGEPVDVHRVMLALNEASAALQMTLQVRGKLLDAYQELMRTPI